MQVPLGILPKSETKYDDMLDILDHVHTYVPSKCIQRSKIVPLTGEVVDFNDREFTTTLIGGDQLTAARARGTQLIRSNCHLNIDSLAGLLPVAEDWHAKLCLLQVYITIYNYSIIIVHQLSTVIM